MKNVDALGAEKNKLKHSRDRERRSLLVRRSGVIEATLFPQEAKVTSNVFPPGCCGLHSAEPHNERHVQAHKEDISINLNT